jgi:hypothetical protein
MIPIVFHNLCNYDAIFFIKTLAVSDLSNTPQVTAQTKEKYIFLSQNMPADDNKLITLKFINSFKFLTSSLEKLGETMKKENFHAVKKKYFTKSKRFF